MHDGRPPWQSEALPVPGASSWGAHAAGGLSEGMPAMGPRSYDPAVGGVAGSLTHTGSLHSLPGAHSLSAHLAASFSPSADAPLSLSLQSSSGGGVGGGGTRATSVPIYARSAHSFNSLPASPFLSGSLSSPAHTTLLGLQHAAAAGMLPPPAPPPPPRHGPQATDAGGGGAYSVEDLLRFVSSVPAGQDVAEVVAPALQHFDSSALAALMKELGRANLGARAAEIFDHLRFAASPPGGAGGGAGGGGGGGGGPGSFDHLLDIYTYTTAISVCSGSQQLQRALELVAEMRARGVAANVHTYSALMNVCIKSNEVALAQDVYQRMLAEGCAPNLVTYNTLIDLYVKTGQWQEAVRLLDKLEEEGIQPEVRTYNTIITACNKSGQPEEGLAIYQRMVAAGVAPTATTFTALISAYGKQGKVEKALGIFADMVQRGCERNVITYSSTIAACEKAGRWELALQLFEQMRAEGCRPNVVTYNSLIAACSHGGHWEKAYECFNQMLAEGCTPDAITYGALITALERGGQWRRALQAFQQMTSQGCHPDSGVYNTLLEACWRSGVVLAQMRAAQLWVLANRSGHFRIYSQAKHDPDLYQHSCIVLTAGAAVITLLRWLSDVRHKVPKDGAAVLRKRVVFVFQKGKASRVEQPSAHIADTLTQLLAGHGSPLNVTLQGNNTHLSSEPAALAAWLRSAAFAPLHFLVQGSGAKRLSVEAVAAEDAAVEARCWEAFCMVRHFEARMQLASKVDQLGPHQRQQVVDLALKYSSALRFKTDTTYDSLELLQRALAAAVPPVAPQLWPLMLAACLMVAARQGEPSAGVPQYEQAAMVTGFAPDAIASTEHHLYLLLAGDVGAISVLRVVHLLLERLGAYLQESRQAQLLSEALHALVYHIACSSAFVGMAPTLVASAVVHCLRQERGIVPYWPAALSNLTGYASLAASPELAACVRQVQALREEWRERQQRQPPPPQPPQQPPPQPPPQQLYGEGSPPPSAAGDASPPLPAASGGGGELACSVGDLAAPSPSSSPAGWSILQGASDTSDTDLAGVSPSSASALLSDQLAGLAMAEAPATTAPRTPPPVAPPGPTALAADTPEGAGAAPPPPPAPAGDDADADEAAGAADAAAAPGPSRTGACR